MSGINEEQIAMAVNKYEKEAEQYYDKYKTHFDLFESSSMVAKTRSLNAMDFWALGKQLERFDEYNNYMNETYSSSLGRLPQIAHDVITAVQSASIIPILASVQPIDEQCGNVYFKQVRSASTKGTQTAGDVVVDPRTGNNTPESYAANCSDGEIGVDPTTGGTTNYNFTVKNPPILAESVRVYLESDPNNVFSIDKGDGHQGMLLGKGMSGTINYETGEIDVDLAADPGAADKILVDYQQDYCGSDDLPRIDSFFDSQQIRSKTYALKGVLCMLDNFSMRKRFGMSAEDELTKDLTTEINREIGGDLIRKLRANALGNTTFDPTPPPNISRWEHKQSWKCSLADAEAVMIGNAGRGTASVLVLGLEHAALVSQLPGFQRLSDGTTLGAHVFGTLDGVTVVRVTESALLGSKEGIVVWKSPHSPFEAACVYSPYMPLTVTDLITTGCGDNPITSQKAAAVMAGVDTLVPAYATQLDLL